jgi:hypothetical protein
MKEVRSPRTARLSIRTQSLLTDGKNLRNLAPNAEVVELVDTLASGASGGNPVEVQVLFSVPL